jgi:broad specificity phosphatase PhoE
MKPQKIFIIRHGESEGNVDKNIYLKKPDYALNLTSTGIEQARGAGGVLKNLIGNDSIGVYYSPFFRTIQTLNNISKTLNDDGINRIAFTREEPRIREQEWHGRIPIDYNENYSEALEAERDQHGTFFYRFDGGESCADVYDRTSDFLNTLHRDFEKQNYPNNILLVTHGMAMRVFMMRWFHKTVAEFETWANPHNCEIFTMNRNDEDNYNFDFSKIRKDAVIHPYQCKLEIY